MFRIAVEDSVASAQVVFDQATIQYSPAREYEWLYIKQIVSGKIPKWEVGLQKTKSGASFLVAQRKLPTRDSSFEIAVARNPSEAESLKEVFENSYDNVVVVPVSPVSHGVKLMGWDD